MNLEDALELAAKTRGADHAVRVVGRLFHRRRVAAEALNREDMVQSDGASAELIAAALHDVLRDTDIEADDLARAGCPRDAVSAVQALTRREGEDYLDFVARAAAEPIARRVKRACLEDVRNGAALEELGEWERYWAVAASRRGQPGGRYQYFLHGRGLARQWRWREMGAEVAVAWPEVIDPGATGGFWAPAPHDSIDGTEISLERAVVEARDLGVDLGAPPIREWSERGPVVRFGPRPKLDQPAESSGSSWLRALAGAAAGLAAAALFTKLRRR